MTAHDQRPTTTRRGLRVTVGLGAAIGGVGAAPTTGYALAPVTTHPADPRSRLYLAVTYQNDADPTSR